VGDEPGAFVPVATAALPGVLVAPPPLVLVPPLVSVVPVAAAVVPEVLVAPPPLALVPPLVSVVPVTAAVVPEVLVAPPPLVLVPPLVSVVTVVGRILLGVLVTPPPLVLIPPLGSVVPSEPLTVLPELLPMEDEPVVSDGFDGLVLWPDEGPDGEDTGVGSVSVPVIGAFAPLGVNCSTHFRSSRTRSSPLGPVSGVRRISHVSVTIPNGVGVWLTV